MNRECPYVADTDKGGHMSLPIRPNGPHPTCSVNECNERDPLCQTCAELTLDDHDKLLVGVGYDANCWLEFLLSKMICCIMIISHSMSCAAANFLPSVCLQQ